MGEERIPAHAAPQPQYLPFLSNLQTVDKISQSRNRNSKATQLTEAFHTLIDELQTDAMQVEATIVLLGPEGEVWASRPLDGHGRRMLPHEPARGHAVVHSMELHLMKLDVTVNIAVRAGQFNPAYSVMLRSIASALQAHAEAGYEEAEIDWLTAMLSRSTRDNERQGTLFHLAKQLHELNDVNAILTEWMTCLDILYPTLPKQLYVSQDHLSPGFHVKSLTLDESDHVCSRAFMEGCIVLGEPSIYPAKSACRAAAVPLKGKQGVYGVLHLASVTRSFVEEDLDFIGLLTDAAGTAFENAQLFEQTVRLVQELQLINEITRRLNQSLKLQDIFQYAVDELTTIFQAEFACIVELDQLRQELVVQASDPVSFKQERVSLDYGFAGLVITRKEPVILSDYRSDCPINSVWMDATEARSLLASPILDHGEAIGAILIAHRAPNYFSYNNYKLLQVLSGHIGLALTNASLHAEVRRMVATDHLTGLYTRHYLDEHIAGYQKKDSCGSLVLLDIDNFKKVNDSHGHQIGDDVLIQVSRIIKSCIRDGDIAARWGGEELAVYFPKVNRELAIHVAERICNKVRLETSPMVTVSCGVSDWAANDEKLSVENLFYRADMALYEAKRSGKNQIQLG